MSSPGKLPIRHRLASPFFDDSEFNAVRETLQSGQLIQGPRVAEFEKLIGDLTGADHVIVVSSGTAALHVLFVAAGIEPGDLVFIPSFGWPSAANVARMIGAFPVLVDVLPRTYNIDPSGLSDRIKESRDKKWGRAGWIVPIHQFGLPCAIDDVMTVAAENNLPVLEDAACALGARAGGQHAGTIGRAGILSFHPRKSITTGEGGAIVTNDSGIAERCRALRNHGQRSSFDFIGPGLNYRLSEIHAALGLAQLAKLDAILRKRCELAAVYLSELGSETNIGLPEPPRSHTWQTFMVRVEGPKRQRIIERLRVDHGVETGVGSVDAHSLGIFKTEPYWRPLPVAAALSSEGLALPLHAGMTTDDAKACAEALKSVLRDL